MAFKKKRSNNSSNRRRNHVSRPLFPRKKYSPLNFMEEIPYKDVELLKSYLTERGRILPRRIIGSTARAQRTLKIAIQRARNIALISFAEGYVPQHEPRVYVQHERFQRGGGGPGGVPYGIQKTEETSRAPREEIIENGDTRPSPPLPS